MEHKTQTQTHHLTEAFFLITSNWTDAQSVFDCWIIHEANILSWCLSSSGYKTIYMGHIRCLADLASLLSI